MHQTIKARHDGAQSGSASSASVSLGEVDAPDLNFEAAFAFAVDKLIAAGLEALRVAALRDERPSVEEIMELYRRTGFLYPDKLAQLEPRLGAVLGTWQKLIDADGVVSKILLRQTVENGALTPKNSMCVVEHTPKTWQLQHLVSADRHEYGGTLAVFIGVIDWLIENPEATYSRFTWREANRGAARISQRIAAEAPQHQCCMTLSDYVVTSQDRIRSVSALPTAVSVGRVDPANADDVTAFYASNLHPVALGSLGLDDFELQRLATKYRRCGLDKTRAVFAAVHGNAVVGAAICNWASEGLNASFLENALDTVVLAGDLSENLRADAFSGLVAAAREYYAERGREYLIALIDPAYSDLAKKVGLVAEKPRRYSTVTLQGNDAFRSARRSVVNYYRSLLLSEAANRS